MIDHGITFKEYRYEKEAMLKVCVYGPILDKTQLTFPDFLETLDSIMRANGFYRPVDKETVTEINVYYEIIYESGSDITNIENIVDNLHVLFSNINNCFPYSNPGIIYNYECILGTLYKGTSVDE